MSEQCILDDIYAYLGRYNIYPHEHARVTAALWMAHTHLIPAFHTTPRLAVISPEKQCGKTRLIEIAKLLCPRSIALVNPSPASLYTLISQERPTLLIDEIQRTFEKKDISDITAILDSGFQQGNLVPRVVFEPKRKVEYFDVFGPILIAGIDNGLIPDTVFSRALPIRLKRRSWNERVEPYRPQDNAAEGNALRERIEGWATEHLEQARKMRPILPKGIEDRTADKWEPLFVVADVADVAAGGGVWGSRAREAALAFLREEKEAEPIDIRTILLKDVRDVYYSTELGKDIFNDRISGEDLLRVLHSISESPWSNLNGRPLDARGLAKMLGAYQIHSKTIRTKDGKTPKGYDFADCYDAWRRYLPEADTPPPPEESATSATTDTFLF